jgi:hypothetical protein
MAREFANYVCLLLKGDLFLVRCSIDTPLQLLAKSLRFRDPLSGRQREFISERELLWCH